MLRTQRPHFASHPMWRKTDATDGRSGREPSDSRTSESERTLQEQTIIASPSLERLQTTFYISRLQTFPDFATVPCQFSDMSTAIDATTQAACRRMRFWNSSTKDNLLHRKK